MTDRHYEFSFEDVLAALAKATSKQGLFDVIEEVDLQFHAGQLLMSETDWASFSGAVMQRWDSIRAQNSESDTPGSPHD
ncbi:hypothetical protein [Marinobacterium jannaschii]|uniref:hypothetical protein n=1 Tax=Marinobacterium jannaschii TaxID=64970 RepID=UPI00047F743B|nr:hypothetical protein [Marinobacterium jannaschii]